MARSRLRPVPLLVAAGVAVAATWRVETSGVVGVNIGGGGLLLLTPVIVAALLLAAVRTEHRTGAEPVRRPRLLAGVAALTAPVLFAVPAGLSAYDRSIG